MKILSINSTLFLDSGFPLCYTLKSTKNNSLHKTWGKWGQILSLGMFRLTQFKTGQWVTIINDIICKSFVLHFRSSICPFRFYVPYLVNRMTSCAIVTSIINCMTRTKVSGVFRRTKTNNFIVFTMFYRDLGKEKSENNAHFFSSHTDKTCIKLYCTKIRPVYGGHPTWKKESWIELLNY